MKEHANTLSEWFERWNNNKIGFHQLHTNPYLEKYFNKFASSTSDILVPLCGKSLDMLWLSSRVKSIIGVELVQKAVDDFISENKLEANVSDIDSFIKYNIGNIDIFAGDIFDFSAHKKLDIFDRASLVALDKNLRKTYSQKILQVLDKKMLLVALEFKDSQTKGPPYSVSEEEVHHLYSSECSIELLDSIDLTSSSDSLRKFDAFEKIFLINRK